LFRVPLFVPQDPSNHLKRGQASFSFTPWPNCLKPNGRIDMIHFPLVAPLVFVLYSRGLFRSSRSVYLFQKALGGWLIFSSKWVFSCLMCAPFSPVMGRFFDHLFSPMSNFSEN
jgi:hypothetical protein